MNCIYNSDLELICVNESMMESYAESLVAIDPSVSEYKQGVQTELRMREFCRNCIQLNAVLQLQRILETLRKARSLGP